MNDPHVQALYYRFKPRDGVTYDNPSALSVAQAAFNGELRNNQFVATMTQHFPTCNEARVSVEAFLRSWEITAALQAGYQEFHFEFDRCEIVDRNPPPPGTIREHKVVMQGGITLSSDATVTVTRRAYPSGPPPFSVTPLVQMLWNRYARYVAGNEPLFSMAYFCLTALERQCAGRRAAAATYQIDFAVLDKLGELSSTRGGPTDARKMTFAALTPATASEQEWVKSAVRAIILQVGMVDGGGAGGGARLTMATLPTMTV